MLGTGKERGKIKMDGRESYATLVAWEHYTYSPFYRKGVLWLSSCRANI